MRNDPNSIRIVIADEQPHFRQELRRLLESDSALCVLGEASDAAETQELVSQLNPDILLIDHDLCRLMKLQNSNGAGSASPARIVAMVTAFHKADIVEAFLLGAQGIVLKASTAQIFLKSIHSVMAGQYWLENDSLGVLVEALRDVLSHGVGTSRPKNYGLTRRELDIITKIVSGRSNKEVGEEFSISERTVKHHLTNIFGKVGVTSRLQLALFAVSHQLNNPATALILQPMQSEEKV